MMARPRIYQEPRLQAVFRLPPDLIARARAEAAAREISFTRFVEAAIERHLTAGGPWTPLASPVERVQLRMRRDLACRLDAYSAECDVHRDRMVEAAVAAACRRRGDGWDLG